MRDAVTLLVLWIAIGVALVAARGVDTGGVTGPGRATVAVDAHDDVARGGAEPGDADAAPRIIAAEPDVETDDKPEPPDDPVLRGGHDLVASARAHARLRPVGTWPPHPTALHDVFRPPA